MVNHQVRMFQRNRKVDQLQALVQALERTYNLIEKPKTIAMMRWCRRERPMINRETRRTSARNQKNEVEIEEF